jgi:hypothetical protein
VCFESQPLPVKITGKQQMEVKSLFVDKDPKLIVKEFQAFKVGFT